MKRIHRLLRGSSRGFTLVEVVIAMFFIGILAIAFLGGLSNSIMILSVAKTHANAETLAYTQMEHVKSLPYADDYDDVDIPSEYEGKGYIPAINATDLETFEDESDNDIILQKIEITVHYTILRYNRDTGAYERIPQSIMLEGYSYKVKEEDATSP